MNRTDDLDCICGHTTYEHLEYTNEENEHGANGKQLGHCWKCSTQECEGFTTDGFSDLVDKIRVKELKKR